MSSYSDRALKALVAANAQGLKVMQVTRDRMTHLAASTTMHTENDKQAIRALERRLKGPAAPKKANNRANNRARNSRSSLLLQSLPAHLFHDKIAPHLAARNLAALQRASKNSKAQVGNALNNARFANQKSGQAPLVRRLRQAFASGMGREQKKAPTRKAFLELQKQGWEVSGLQARPAHRSMYGVGSRTGADAAWRQWMAQVVIPTPDGTSITVRVTHDSFSARAWNNGTLVGEASVKVNRFRQWTLWLHDSNAPLARMIQDAFRNAARAQGVSLETMRAWGY